LLLSWIPGLSGLFEELAQTFDKKNQQLTAENQKLADSVYLSVGSASIDTNSLIFDALGKGAN